MLDNIGIGNQITSLRKQSKLTQEELSAKLGVTAQTISKWENGHTLPETASLPLLAKLFGCTVDTILMSSPAHDTAKPCPFYDSHPFTKAKICPCKMDEDTVAKTIEVWEQTKEVKAFVSELERRRVKGKKIWYDEDLNTIFIAKVFAGEFGGGNPENDCLIGRACHCHYYNHLKEFYPKYYCQCSAEYYRPMFEPMFGKDIELYPFKTVLSGDDECIIGIKLGGKRAMTQ